MSQWNGYGNYCERLFFAGGGKGCPRKDFGAGGGGGGGGGPTQFPDKTHSLRAWKHTEHQSQKCWSNFIFLKVICSYNPL